MDKYNVKLTNVTRGEFTDLGIRTLEVDYYCEEQKDNFTKILYHVYDVEKAIGYERHGWTWFKTYACSLKAFGIKYTDAKNLLNAFDDLAIRGKRRKLVNDEFIAKFRDILEKQYQFESQCNVITLDEAKQLLELGVEHWVTIDRSGKESQVISNKEEAMAANGRLMSELLNAVKVDNEIADKFNNVFDSAKEIASYGDLVREETELTREIADIRVQIVDLSQKLKVKELRFKQNQKSLEALKQSLVNNPLLNLVDAASGDGISKEVTERLMRLETENKALKDRIGEGENFKTSAMFPNKKKYFSGDEKEINSKIGLSLSKMANSKGIQINKVRSGAMEVGNYPVWLHQKLEEFIVNKSRNEFTFILNPVLREEYRV